MDYMQAIFLIGRILFGGYFLIGGLGHFMKRPLMTQYAASKKVPAPGLAVAISGLMILLGGLSVLLGAWPNVGFALILIFLAVVTPKMHNFWAISDPNQRLTEMTNFMKNLALFGAALILLSGVSQPWPLSLGG